MERALLGTWIAAWMVFAGPTAQSAEKSAEKKETPIGVVRFQSPELVFDIKDGKKGKEFLESNSWMKDLRRSPLFEGLTLRISPFLTQIGSEETEGWKGKLLDYLYDKVLEGRPIRVQYFHRYGLASPFATTIAGLSGGEKKLLQAIVKLGDRYKGEAPKVKLEKDGKTSEVEVTPIEIKYQRFAIRFHGDCFTFSRDPKIAAMASEDCPEEKEFKEDLVVRVSTKAALPSLHAFASRFFGVGEWIQTSWEWSHGGFEPKKLDVPLHGESVLGTGKGFASLMDAIPASSWLVLSAQVPDPQDLGSANIKTYLSQAPATLKKRPSIPVALVHLGASMEKKEIPVGHSYTGEDGSVQEAAHVTRNVYAPLTALLIPSKKEGEPLLLDLSKLFGEKTLYEAKFRKVCGGFVAVSDQESAIALVEQACARKTPSLSNLPANVGKGFASAESMAVLLQPANWLSAAIAQGWKRLGSGADQPAGVKEADALVRRLPLIMYSGKVDGSTLRMEGTL